MENTVLSEHQSACRAAHEQVQLLQHLYSRVAERDGVPPENPDQGRRPCELRQDRQLLVAKLKSLGLLRTEPDPERESLLDMATELKRAFGGRNADAVSGRLLAEEREFLSLCEQLARHDEDAALVETMQHTRAAIERLQSR